MTGIKFIQVTKYRTIPEEEKKVPSEENEAKEPEKSGGMQVDSERTEPLNGEIHPQEIDIPMNEANNEELQVRRKEIRNMLLEGKFEQVGEYIKANFTSLWNEDKNLRNSIWALQLIEYLKEQKIKEALEYSANHFTEGGYFVTRNIKGYEIFIEVKELLTLFCYEKIEESPLKHLLSPMQREAVGDYINSKILEMKGKDKDTILEKALKQLVAIQNYQLEKQKVSSTFKLKV